MRTLVLGAAAAALLVATMPAAHAASDSTYAGACQLNAQPTNQDVWVGVLSGIVNVFSATTPTDNPVSANVTCEVRVNGVYKVAHTTPGTTWIIQANLVEFAAAPTDVIEVCITVDYTSNTTPTASSCNPWP